MLTVVVRSVFEEDGKFYSQFLDERLYELKHDRIDISK